MPTVYGEIQVGATGPTFVSFDETITHTTLGDWSSSNGYGVIDVAKSLGIPDTAPDLSLKGKNNNLALDLINAPSAWQAGYTGKGVKVAVIDSGIAASTEIAGKIIDGYDFKDGDTDPSPANGAYKDHSLGVASIIAANHDNKGYGPDTSGVAPDAQLLNVRTAGPDGGNLLDIAKGIRWSVDHGADVICLPQQSPDTGTADELYSAIKYAYDHNVVTVIIGGNFSIYGASGPALAAKDGIAIAVGNFDVAPGIPFNSSNLPGATPFPWVMASSTGYVPNSDGGYTYYQDGGTSFAGPYVAGLAALLVQKYPDATAKFIIDKIIEGATGIPNTGHNFIGDAGNNTFINTTASDVITGLGGIDTVQYTGKRDMYTVKHEGDKFIVTDNATATVDTMLGVERLQFSDKSVALDTDGNAGTLYRLYQAAFDRTPDQQGLGFWLRAMDQGKAPTDVASGFLNSPEAKKLYGNLDATNFLTQLYANVLDRKPDAAGLAWHLNNLNHGVSMAQTLVGFSESAENVAKLVGVMTNGVDYIPSA
jgi:subtilisin family serine protease